MNDTCKDIRIKICSFTFTNHLIAFTLIRTERDTVCVYTTPGGGDLRLFSLLTSAQNPYPKAGQCFIEILT